MVKRSVKNWEEYQSIIKTTVKINECKRPDNENIRLNELLCEEINYRMTVNERIINKKAYKNFEWA